MGFYLEVEHPLDKAQQLIQRYGAVATLRPDRIEDIPEGQVLICVVKNGPFDAAGIVFDQGELEAFARPDPRPKSWLLMPREKVLEMKPYVASVLAY